MVKWMEFCVRVINLRLIFSLNTKQGIIRSPSIKTLNLSGNNMSGSCVVVLGALLSLSPGLARLYLEWNCVGQDQESFAQFCSGLAANTSLEILDLRSQQQPCGQNGPFQIHFAVIEV